MSAIGETCIFVQQYDPFTGRPSLESLEGMQDSYGPAMLSVMEYAARMYGIHMEHDKIYWGTTGGHESLYEQIWGKHVFKIKNSGFQSEAFVDGKKIFEAGKDLNIITDINGKLLDLKQFNTHADIRQIKTFL
ncbi:MAG TPA: hypothetical protein DDW53_07125 [Lachnoclostridium sp.]|nr:hypothetical protein [Lachnoclostridium sp.]